MDPQLVVTLVVIKAQLNTLTQIVKDFNQELKSGAPIITFAAKKVVKESVSIITPEVALVIKEYSDVFLEDLPDKLPPMCDIQHAIDLVPGASLPNLPHYRRNLTEYEELKRQVNLKLSISEFPTIPLLIEQQVEAPMRSFMVLDLHNILTYPHS